MIKIRGFTLACHLVTGQSISGSPYCVVWVCHHPSYDRTYSLVGRCTVTIHPRLLLVGVYFTHNPLLCNLIYTIVKEPQYCVSIYSADDFYTVAFLGLVLVRTIKYNDFIDLFLSAYAFYHADIELASTNLLPYIPISKDRSFTAIAGKNM